MRHNYLAHYAGQYEKNMKISVGKVEHSGGKSLSLIDLKSPKQVCGFAAEPKDH